MNDDNEIKQKPKLTYVQSISQSILSHKVTFIILIVNIIFYIIELMLYYLYNTSQSFYCITHILGAKDSDAIIHHYQLWRLILPIILHGSFIHLIMNTISLYRVGSKVEDLIGSKDYLILYIVSGIYSNLFSSIYSSQSITVGASGSLMGLCGFMSLYFVSNCFILSYKERRSAIVFFLMLMANVLLTKLASYMTIIDAIDNASHYGGYISGLLLSVFILIKEQYLRMLSRCLLVVLTLYCIFGLYLDSIEVFDYRSNCYSNA